MHLEHSRVQYRRVVVAGHGPGHYHLARSEDGLAERNPTVDGRRPPGFLLEFPDGRLFVLLILFDHAFDDGPGAHITTGEEGATGMGDHYFETAVQSVGEKTR